ncbi:hypothetical protein CNO08_24910 [Lysobacter capsici]|nr:hypothetical protein CNO08_24910 [Lysobacter capsici]
MHGLVLVATRHAARSDPRICDAHRDNEKNFAPRRIGVRVFRRSFVARAKTGASSTHAIGGASSGPSRA